MVMIPKKGPALQIARKVLKSKGVKLPDLSKKDKKELRGSLLQH